MKEYQVTLSKKNLLDNAHTLGLDLTPTLSIYRKNEDLFLTVDNLDTLSFHFNWELIDDNMIHIISVK